MKPRARPLLLIAALLAAPVGAAEVQAPHWGDTLFRFYQGQHFGAVTTLMASQQMQRVAPHGDEAEALRGGLLLSYGVHREAAAIFERLAEQGMTPAVRDRAWFYLAKIRWQRGLADAAAQALDRVAGPLPAELQQERVLLDAQMRLARGDHDGAAQALAQASEAEGGTPYARFNLGVALLRAGKADEGRQWLDKLGQSPAADEEQRSLRDRANVALGFAALQDGQAKQARDLLERVRLNGPFSNKALLGFGWAASALKQPRSALVPWQELNGRDAGDPSVLEARLAVPYAYAELEAWGQARDGYQQAIAAYDQEAMALDQTIAALRQGRWIDALLDRNPGADLGWMWRVEDLPELPHPAHLAPLLATHGVQEALKDQRDLRFLLGNLRQWSTDLGVYRDMLATRRQAYAQRLPKVQADDRAARLAALTRQRADLAAAIDDAARRADGHDFADAGEREALARVARARAILARPDLDREAAERAGERLRRLAGALEWQLAQAHPARVWEARKALRTIEAELAQATVRDEALLKAQSEEPARFDAFDGRIGELEKRVQNMIPPLVALQAEQQQALQEAAVNLLMDQKARLLDYGAQARFALAQLQDRATMARHDDDAPPTR